MAVAAVTAAVRRSGRTKREAGGAEAAVWTVEGPESEGVPVDGWSSGADMGSTVPIFPGTSSSAT